jgi:hypothetical protein
MSDQEGETPTVIGEPASRKQPGDDKFHFIAAYTHPSQKRIIQEHIGAAWGRTAEQALKEMFESYREHGHTRPIKQWEESDFKEEHSIIREHPDDDDPTREFSEMSPDNPSA